jgi:Bacterial Ig-like domain (group 3)/Fibronectin type III domain
MRRKTPVLLVAAGTAIATLFSFAPVVFNNSLAGASGSPPVAPTTIYDTTSTPLVASPSFSFEATTTNELGNQIQFAGSSRLLNNVVVTMDSWGCQSGTWTDSPICVTTPGSTFSEPLTLNLYNVGIDGISVGSPIASITQTFNIPYRPSTDPSCPLSTDDGSTGDQETFMYDGSCVHGLPVNVTFNLGDVVVPDNVIWSIAYNTSDYGAAPYGDLTACHSTSEGCGYDSLNVLATIANGPSVGSDTFPGTAYVNGASGYPYCDNGANGMNSLRLDSADGIGTAPCNGNYSANSPSYTGAPWYIPAAQFNAVPEISVGSSNTTSNFGQSVKFTATAPPTATGLATILVDGSPVGACLLSGGSCGFSTSGLTVGSHAITASYGGDGNFPAFSSAAISQAVAAIVPSAPNGPKAVPGSGTATVSWSAPSKLGGSPITSYAVTATPGGATCSTSGTSCSIGGLTNGTPYTFAVIARNVAGAGPSSSAHATPATTGFHLYALPPVIEFGSRVVLSATGAQSNSFMTFKVAGHGSQSHSADAFGAASVKFTLSKPGAYAISARNLRAVARGWVYAAKVAMPVAALHIYAIPVTVHSAIPGSKLEIKTSDDGTFSVPVPSSGNVIVELPRAPFGTCVVSVADNGYPLKAQSIIIS